MCKANYATHLLSQIEGIKTPVFKSAHFKEFTINFDDVGVRVKEIHEKLLQRGIHGGKDVSKEFPELGETALYCISEIHSTREIELLASVLKKILAER